MASKMIIMIQNLSLQIQKVIIQERLWLDCHGRGQFSSGCPIVCGDQLSVSHSLQYSWQAVCVLVSDDPVPLSEPRQSLIAPCLGLGAHEAIAGYTAFSLQRCQ